MGSSGLEPPTSRLSGARSNLLSYEPVPFSTLTFHGGDERVRTAGLLLARQALSHLSYTPMSVLSFSLALPKILPYLQNYIVLSASFSFNSFLFFLLHLRKEVIQPHLPIRLPCYDFTPVIDLAFDGSLLAVKLPASGAPNSHGVTGGVYKARERIHRGMLIRDY